MAVGNLRCMLAHHEGMFELGSMTILPWWHLTVGHCLNPSLLHDGVTRQRKGYIDIPPGQRTLEKG